MAFFQELGFELAMIMPADAPTTAELVGHGLRLRLDPAAPGGPGALRLTTTGPTAHEPGPASLVAPNGTIVELVTDDGALDLPQREHAHDDDRRASSARDPGD